jgi:hypothetical protein
MPKRLPEQIRGRKIKNLYYYVVVVCNDADAGDRFRTAAKSIFEGRFMDYILVRPGDDVPKDISIRNIDIDATFGREGLPSIHAIVHITCWCKAYIDFGALSKAIGEEAGCDCPVYKRCVRTKREADQLITKRINFIPPSIKSVAETAN